MFGVGMPLIPSNIGLAVSFRSLTGHFRFKNRQIDKNRSIKKFLEQKFIRCVPSVSMIYYANASPNALLTNAFRLNNSI